MAICFTALLDCPARLQQVEGMSAAGVCSIPGSLLIMSRERHLPVHKQLSHELLQGGPVALDQSAHLRLDVQCRIQALAQAALTGDGT